MHYCSNSVSTGIPTWVVDTGASDHMVHDMTLFTSPPQPSAIKIKSPNNFIATATLSCYIKLNDDLTLHNVLNVPDLLFNLLSISHLTKTTKCAVSFLDSHCLF